MATDRVHRLAQAAQVGDLLAERAEQLLDALEAFDELDWCHLNPIPPDPDELDEVAGRVTQVRTNLRRQVDAYRSVRG